MNYFRCMLFGKPIHWLSLAALLCCQVVCGQTYNPNKKYTVQALKEDFSLLRSAVEKVHPGTYWYSPKDSISIYFDRAYSQIDHEMTEREFYRLILPVLAQIRCGHTYPEMSKAYLESDRPKKQYLPFKLFFENDRLFIVQNLSTDSSLGEGDEIMKLGDIPVSEMAKRARTLQSADGNNESWKNKFVALFYLEEVYTEYYGGKSPFPITVIDTKGVTRETTVSAPEKMIAPAKPKAQLSRKEFIKQEKARLEEERAALIKFRLTKSDSSAAILKIGGFSYEVVHGASYQRKHAAIFQMIAERNIQNLVIDLRGNTGGNLNIVENLMSYLMDKPFKSSEKNELQTSDVNYMKTLIPHFEKGKRGRGFQWKGLKKIAPDTYTYRFSKTGKINPSKKYRFDGNVYIITDGWVFSAASLFVSSLRSQRKITVVGEETGGAAVGCNGGRISRLILPNTQVRVFFPHFRIYAVTDAKPDGHGVIPDYVVKPTLSDIANERDPEMKKVFELIFTK